MTIEREIAGWDGKSADDIARVYERHGDDPAFAAQILTLMAQQNRQNGASWLLKKHFESGGELEEAQVKEVYRLLPKLAHWEARLHVLQSIPFMPIARTDKNKVETFLRDCLIDHNKFIRAWAYNGFYELAVQHAEYQPEVRQFFAMAMRDEAASVRARIRNLMKNSRFQIQEA